MGRKKADIPPAPVPVSGEAPDELSPGKLLARRVALWSVVAALGIAALGVGYSRLQRHVEARYATPAEPPRVVLKNRPAWMNDFLASRITSVARPAMVSSAFDRKQLTEVHDQLLSDPDVRAWIEKIHSIRRVYGGGPGDTIELDATFRAPVALVRAGDAFWMVDSSGVKLPEKFDADQVPRVVVGKDGKLVVRVIDGVRRPPPDAGFAWKGDDLQAGLELLRLIHDKPFAQEIVKLDVANFGGRVNNAAAQLVMVTRFNTEVRWGRPVTSKDYFVEVSPARKLEVLARIVSDYGQVDAKRPWIDIRFDRVTFPRSVTPTSPSGNTGDGATTAADVR